MESGLSDARSIFDALHRISQIESGRRQAGVTEIDLFDTVEVLFEIYQPVVEEGARTLEIEGSKTGRTLILGDVDLIRQAVAFSDRKCRTLYARRVADTTCC